MRAEHMVHNMQRYYETINVEKQFTLASTFHNYLQTNGK